ncbi:hypothetical protein GX586_12525 [bacterium]|nr:hypothetical protein [bacterium]
MRTFTLTGSGLNRPAAWWLGQARHHNRHARCWRAQAASDGPGGAFESMRSASESRRLSRRCLRNALREALDLNLF